MGPRARIPTKNLGPRARIPTKILVGKIVTGILTNLMQKVMSSENPTVPRVIILFEFIEDILTLDLHFVNFFELKSFPAEARTRPVTAWSRQRGRSNLITSKAMIGDLGGFFFQGKGQACQQPIE